jgi:SpoVK/Ycf46/Vps4 family AAA+-type ATPase
VSDARDRYANQDISFLLQRLEDFDGLSILASNLKSNIDEAFMRRFQSVIFFPLPTPELRYLLWKKAIPARAKLEESVDLQSIADKYALTGAAIMNVVRYASLKAIDREDQIIRQRDLVEGIRRGFLKEGKVM